MVTEQIDVPAGVASAEGLDGGQAATVRALMEAWQGHVASNRRNEDYYEGRYPVESLGIAIDPDNAGMFQERVDWARKAVDYIACRSQFDGFSAAEDDGGTVEWLRRWVADNDVHNAYAGAVTSALTHSCCFATVTVPDGAADPVLRFYPATAASALWDRRLGRIGAGMVVVDMEDRPGGAAEPSLVEAYTDAETIVLRRTGGGWIAESEPHTLGRCPMVALCNRPSLRHPFGRSKIGPGLRSIIGEASEVMNLMKLAVQFAAAPQTYALGLDPDAMGETSPLRKYMDRLWAVSKDEDGDVPTFGQLPQQSMEPLLSTMRTLSSMAAADANVPAETFGVVTDNPSSAEAINASREDAVIEVNRLNRLAGAALRDAALTALAMRDDVPFDEAAAAHPTVAAKFRPASTPSEASVSDAMLKQSQIIEWLADSDVLLKRLGYTDEEIADLEETRRGYRSSRLAEVIASGMQPGPGGVTTGDAEP